ncbi:hypothetical protein M3Y97_00492400 [Aphelenchoides bicaudatus]|nr:hypothetical protein M3Y97_00492400 [Aphelenchoides bicaudatus]
MPMSSKIKPQEASIKRQSSSFNDPKPQLHLTDLEAPKKSNEKSRRTCGQFLRKYFLEGQKLDDELQKKHLDPNLPWHERHRKYLAFLIPFLFFQMPITMILGAFVSGATAEGGGAVAFPVMTLLLHLDPTVARDFSLMIQSCGMTASSFTVIYMRVKVEWHSIIFSSLGAFFSIILGLQFWDDVLTGPQKKMGFVSIWFAFAVSLLILNLQHKRKTYDSIPNFNWWKALVLFGTGFFGGLLSAFTGSGVDICSFSILTLLFRVSEKVATPTSVVLMCLNTLVGFYWRQLIMKDISELAWEYFSVSVPVVVTMSPIGAFVSSHLHRQILAGFPLIGFLITKPATSLLIAGAIIIAIGTAFFFGISQLGRIISDRVEANKSSKSSTTNSVSSAPFTELSA